MTTDPNPCAGYIILSQKLDKVLLVTTHSGNISFPKGKKDIVDGKLETSKVCALRELWEETGVDVDDFNSLDIRYYVDEPSKKGNPAIRLHLGILKSDLIHFKPIDTNEIVKVELVDINLAKQILNAKRYNVLVQALNFFDI